MGTPANLEDTLERLYTALSTADLETWIALHDPAVVFNVNGSTAVSGRIRGVNLILSKLLPLLFERLQPGSQIGVNWRVMCADDKRAVVIFEGRAHNLDDEPYNNRYCQILEFNDSGLIAEVWEFFDTALADKLVFTDNPVRPEESGEFQY